MLTVMACIPAHAQKTSDVPPGMEERGDPFSNSGATGPVARSGATRPAVSEKSAASTSPSEVRGVTRYPNGLPIPGAEVVILSADANVARTVVSENDGTFAFKNLKPGEYQLSARKEGYSPYRLWNKLELVAGKRKLPCDRTSRLGQASRYHLSIAEWQVRHGHRPIRPTEFSQPVCVSQCQSLLVKRRFALEMRRPLPRPSLQRPRGLQCPAAVVEELTAMRKRIDELEAELKGRVSPDQPAAEAPAPAPVAATPQAAPTAETPKLLPGQYLSAAGTPTYFKGDTRSSDAPRWLGAFFRTRTGPG